MGFELKVCEHCGHEYEQLTCDICGAEAAYVGRKAPESWMMCNVNILGSQSDSWFHDELIEERFFICSSKCLESLFGAKLQSRVLKKDGEEGAND